jgi:DNA-binding NtrC family response regulator
MSPLDALLERPASTPTASRPAQAQPYRILVADDQRDVTEALRLLLSMHDFGVVSAASPVEAVAAAAAQPLDAALIDLNYDKGRTTGEQGLELITALKKHAPALPVVVMTAWSSIDLALEAVRRGARDFVEKPWDESRLIAILRSQAELGRALRRVAELESEIEKLRATSSVDGGQGTLTAMRLLDVEGLLVKQAMERHAGNVSRAARALGLSRSALYRRLERHKI